MKVDPIIATDISDMTTTGANTNDVASGTNVNNVAPLGTSGNEVALLRINAIQVDASDVSPVGPPLPPVSVSTTDVDATTQQTPVKRPRLEPAHPSNQLKYAYLNYIIYNYTERL